MHVHVGLSGDIPLAHSINIILWCCHKHVQLMSGCVALEMILSRVPHLLQGAPCVGWEQEGPTHAKVSPGQSGCGLAQSE